MHLRPRLKPARIPPNTLEILRPDEKTLIVTTKTCRVHGPEEGYGRVPLQVSRNG